MEYQVNGQKCPLIEKLRQPKIFQMAVFDWLATFIMVGLLSRKRPDVSIWKITLALVLMGIITHYVLGIPTMLNYYLGLSPKPPRQVCP